jgi:hypothetical protein
MGPEAYHTCADLERGLKVESTTLLFCTAYDPVWVISSPKDPGGPAVFWQE